MAYDGSVDLISGIRQANNGTFALVDASAVRVSDSKRLDESLTDIGNDKADKANPVFTGSISRNRNSSSTAGDNSTAIGRFCTASGEGSFAEGDNTEAVGAFSHSKGLGTIANGAHSHVLGEYNVAETIVTTWTVWDHNHSYHVGDRASDTITTTVQSRPYYTRKYLYCIKDHTSSSSVTNDISDGDWYVVSIQGKFSLDDFEDPAFNLQLEIVGNGAASYSRSNARVLDRFGNECLKGDLYVQCDANSSNGKKVATQEYVDALEARILALETAALNNSN